MVAFVCTPSEILFPRLAVPLVSFDPPEVGVRDFTQERAAEEENLSATGRNRGRQAMMQPNEGSAMVKMRRVGAVKVKSVWS